MTITTYEHCPICNKELDVVKGSLMSTWLADKRCSGCKAREEDERFDARVEASLERLGFKKGASDV